MDANEVVRRVEHLLGPELSSVSPAQRSRLRALLREGVTERSDARLLEAQEMTMTIGGCAHSYILGLRDGMDSAP